MHLLYFCIRIYHDARSPERQILLPLFLICPYVFPLNPAPSLPTGCPTRYRTRHFFNNFPTNEDIATKFEADLPHCVRHVATS